MEDYLKLTLLIKVNKKGFAKIEISLQKIKIGIFFLRSLEKASGQNKKINF